MNILLGALLLALLLLPGFIFRMGYLAKPFASKSFSSSFVEELLFSLLPAFFLQVIGYGVVKLIGTVNEKTFLLLLINSDKAIDQTLHGSDILLFAGYLLIVCSFALLAGFLLRYIALRTRLHLRFAQFRIYNEWQIYFDGWILDYPDQPGERMGQGALKQWLDVLVENKNGAFIYSGFLNEYVLGKDDSLSRIYLTAVQRRKLEDDAKPTDILPASTDAELAEVDYDQPEDEDSELEQFADTRYYFMPGDYFMIPGSDIKSINITYYTVESTDAAS
jgi:hypothetical protein